MSKSCLQWITIASEQAMLMFVCLQNMVDELLNRKDGNDFNNIQVIDAVINSTCLDASGHSLSSCCFFVDNIEKLERIFRVNLVHICEIWSSS